MNVGALIGFILAQIIFSVSVYLTLGGFQLLMDFNSALIVIGGTAAVTFVSFPTSQLIPMLKVFLKRAFGANRKDYGAIIIEIVSLAKVSLQGQKAYDAFVQTIKDPFLKDGAEMLFWAKSDISSEELRDLLETRAKTHYRLYSTEAKVFKGIAKFPPAFGLLGTAMGMVALLAAMSDPNAKNKLGQAMAVALITTIYGLAIANLILIPIGENLQKQTEEDFTARTLVVEGLMLIAEEKPPRYVEEKLKSYLLPTQRQAFELKKVA